MLDRILAILLEPVTEPLGAVMGQIEDLQASVDQLDRSVRTLIAAGDDRADALQEELDVLKADDAVEDSKLEGLQAQVDGLRVDVSAAIPPSQP